MAKLNEADEKFATEIVELKEQAVSLMYLAYGNGLADKRNCYKRVASFLEDCLACIGNYEVNGEDYD